MKKRKIAAILVLICLMVVSLCSCGQDEKAIACLDDLSRGLEGRWTLQEPDILDQRPDYYAEGAKVELNAVEKYANAEFKDEAFGQIIDDYIGALRSQQEGSQYYFSNAKKFNDLYYRKGYDVRSDCLKQLHDNYSFDVGSDYQDELSGILSKPYFSRINPGKTVDVKTEVGDLKVDIEGISKSGWNSFDTSIDKGDDVFLLKCLVENVSYNDEYNPGFISLNICVSVQDESGILIQPYGTAYDTGSYIAGAGAFFQLPQGAKSKVAIPYVISKNTSRVLVTIASNDNKYYELVLNVK